MIFGNIPINPKQLVSELDRLVSEATKSIDLRKENTAWTASIKKALAAMAKKSELQPFYSDSAEEISEFLLDVVWWEEKGGSRRAALGVECEWGDPRSHSIEHRANQVIEDFEKLLQFKAPLKLMIFSADNAEMRRATHKKLLEYLRSFAQHVSGECYVFVEFASGCCYSYQCDIRTDGRDEQLQIVPLDESSASALRPSP
jgi:hypothetical protein